MPTQSGLLIQLRQIRFQDTKCKLFEQFENIKEAILKKFISLTVLLVVSRLVDIFTTYKYIPDLQGEKNPLVSILKMGWTGTLIIQGLGLCLLVYTLYIYCFKTVNTKPIDKSTTLKEFISIFHFGNPHDFSKILYKLPSNKYSFIYSLGAILPKGLIIFSLLVGASTSKLILSESYRSIYRDFHIPSFLYLLSGLIMIFLAINFL